MSFAHSSDGLNPVFPYAAPGSKFNAYFYFLFYHSEKTSAKYNVPRKILRK